jgi:catechol 2,3-dioxygenase-like lactoylglutathione lyase family enzyme
MINGVHAIIYSKDAEAARAFFRDVLGYHHVDAGRGWLIFAVPPAEVAVHPAEEGSARQELFFMCDDLDATLAQLGAKGVRATGPIHDAPWGRVTSIRIAEDTEIGIYQPKHPVAIR